MANDIAEELAALGSLSRLELKVRWQATFGRPAPSRISRDMMLRALAYHIQEEALGGLSKATRRRLAKLADSVDNGGPALPALRLKPGTRLVREWGGRAHHVIVRDDGFEYGGEHYMSLSAIARVITGTRWSGPLFFGLRKTRRENSGAQ